MQREKDMDAISELKKCIKGDVSEDEKILDQYSRDASLFVVRPQAVVFPKDGEDVKNLVRFVIEKRENEPRLSLTARAAGTDMTGGPLSQSVVVAFSKYFNRIKNISAEDKTAVVEPGVYYRDFARELEKHNLLFPPYPASRDICAMGGIVNNNSAGEKTLRYGQAKDYVVGLKAVLADGNEYVIRSLGRKELAVKLALDGFEGELYRKMYALVTENHELLQRAKPKVSKNSSGYLLWDIWDKEKDVFDLTKVFVGAQGTLGIMTEATLKLVTPEKHSQMVILFLDELNSLGDLVNTVLELKPTTFESYDDKTLKLAVKFFWQFIKRLGARHIISIAFNAMGEFVSILRHGFPRLVLQITFDGNDKQELRDRALSLAERLKKFNPRYLEVIKSEREAQEYWLIRRESFGLLRHKIKDKKTAPFIDDIVVEPKHLPEFLPKLNEILKPYENRITYTIAGHIGNGNFHIIPLMNLEKDEQRQIIPELADKVYQLVLAYGGSMSGEHNDGLTRTSYLKQMFGEKVYALFEETKRIFDPAGIFNPGKKTGGDREFALQHIRRE